MFKGISFADTMLVTAAGITIVFLVLLLLIIIFAIFGAVANSKSKPKVKKAHDVSEVPTIAPVTVAPVVDSSDDDELVAVISAAALEYLAEDGKTYAVRSITRSKGDRSAWANAGIVQNNSSFIK